MDDRKDYIGFDPVLWVERLRDVNGGSQFSSGAKAMIEEALRELQDRLEKTYR